MTLKSMIAADNAVFLNTNDFAETITYVTVAGASSSVSAIVQRGADLGQNTFGLSGYLTITLARTAVANPQVHDTLTIADGTTARVESVINGDADMWTILAASDPRPIPSGAS